MTKIAEVAMNRPWMPLFVADYLKDTRGLTTTQHGAYLLLIIEYWIKGALPNDDKQLARITGMSALEWKKTKPVIQAFFRDGWKHKRLDQEIAKFSDKQTKRQDAGKRGGIARANGQAKAKQTAKQKPADAQASSSDSRKKDSDANASGADAPTDHRKRLFSEGLEKLAQITGKGPDACRAFVGKCLKAANDDAVVVLGLIEDAERNQIVNPSAWIAAHLKSKDVSNAKAQGGSLIAALDRALEQSQDADLAAAENPVLSLPKRPVQ